MSPEFVTNHLHNNMQRGQRLFTRDGRIRGNAIILGVRACSLLRQAVYLIEAEFSNRFELTKSEINSAYYVVDRDGKQSIVDPDQWRDNKVALIELNLIEDSNSVD